MKNFLDEIIINWQDSQGNQPHLEIENITYGSNGYPKNIEVDYFIQGFDNFQQLEEFTKEFKAEIHLFKKRDGWQFWEDKGWKSKPLTVDDYIREEGDNCNIINLDNNDIQEQLHDLANDFDGDFSIFELYISETQQKLEAVENAGVGYTVVQNDCEIQTIADEMLFFYSDVWSYQIGAFFSQLEFDLQKEEQEEN